MKNLEISGQLKSDIENNQKLLTNAIRNHQIFVMKVNKDPENLDLQKELRKAEQEIVLIGLAQKDLLVRFREELKVQQKNFKSQVTKNEDRATSNRVRKQNIVSRSTSDNVSLGSDDSLEMNLNRSPQGPDNNPLEPQDVPQPEFLHYFGLVTPNVYKEMQNRRVERKRRSTVNPHFIYGNKSAWEFQTTKRAKRNNNNAYIFSVSPPNTRQAMRRKNEKNNNTGNNNNSSPPSRSPPQQAQQNGKETKLVPFPTIPNLPSGLTIERVSPGSSSPDSKTCLVCRQPGVLSICESCSNGFHVSCHNRPLTTSPRQCPRCIVKEVRTVGSLNVPSGMSVSYVTAAEVSEKLNEKKRLETKNQTLTAELTQLQDRHSQLTICLKNQKCQQEELLMNQQTTEEKIKQILTFINQMKGAKDSDSKK